tara:strand:- start:702 stop:887 length:186 start_codon:yes stop_codon:yes gene_type:complete
MNCTTIENSKVPYLAMEKIRAGEVIRARVLHLGVGLGPFKPRFLLAGVRPIYSISGMALVP